MLLSWMLLNGHDEHMAKFHTREESTIIGSQFERVSLHFLSLFHGNFFLHQPNFFYIWHMESKVKFVSHLKFEIRNPNPSLLSHHSHLHHFLLSVSLSEILSSSSLQFVLDLYQSMVHLHQSVYDCRCVRHCYAIALVSHRELCYHLMCFFFQCIEPI